MKKRAIYRCPVCGRTVEVDAADPMIGFGVPLCIGHGRMVLKREDTMTREQLRAKLIGGIDWALGHPFILSTEYRHMLEAQKLYWSQASDADLDKLLSLMA